jgi:oligopeptide transport system permease protein
MMRYVIQRVLLTLLSLWVIVTLTFFLMKALPGDPFTQDRALPKEVMEALYEHYKLNDPLFVQYGNYLKQVMQGDLGPSFKYKTRSVNSIIAAGFPISATLGLEALFLALSVGVFLGTIAAIHHNRWQDFTAMLIAILGISIPSFILAAFLQYIFAIKLDLLPVARWGTFAQSILPAISLAAMPAAVIARLTRTNMIEVLKLDYIKTAKAKGLSKWRVIVFHAWKAGLLPVATYLSVLLANVLTGSFIIEKIFGIPGLGGWFINSITNRDYTVIMGVTIFYSVILLTTLFLVDLLYCWMDPRVRLQGGERL